MQPEKPLKHILEELAASTYQKKGEGYYSLKDESPLSQPANSLREIIEQCDDLKQNKFGLHDESSDNSSSPELIEGKLKEIGIEKFSLLSDAGANAVILEAEHKNFYNNVVVRIVKAGRNDKERVKNPAVLQPLETYAFNEKGEEIKSDEIRKYEKGTFVIEVLPKVALLKDCIDTMDLDESQKKSLLFSAYQSYQDNLSDDIIVIDVGQPQDLAILPGGTMVNVDGGAIDEKHTLAPDPAKNDKLEKKYLNLMEDFNNHLSVLLMKDRDTPVATSDSQKGLGYKK